MDTKPTVQIKLISGRSHVELSKMIASNLNLQLTKCTLDDFANGEIKVEINEPVRNFDVYIIQTGLTDDTHSINDYIIELFSIINACKLSSAKSVSVILPCYPYARSDKKDGSRVPINAAMITNILEGLGVNRIISLDLHSGQIQGFARIPFDNLYGIKILANSLNETIFKNKDNYKDSDQLNSEFILVSPDEGGSKRVEAYAKRLGMKFVTMHKQRDYSKKSTVVSSILIGEQVLLNKTAIIIDDIIDTMGTMISASQELKNHGIKDVIIVATHGVFSEPAITRINECDSIKQIIVTNSINQTANLKKTQKLVVVDTSDLFADTIRRLVHGHSISELFS